MKSKIYISSILLVLIIFICAGTFQRAGLWLLKKDNPEHADALVILMGSVSDRVQEAADLYKQNVIGKILIVGPDEITSIAHEEGDTNITNNSQQSLSDLVAMGIPPDSVIILPGYANRRTLTEAMIIREYCENKTGIDTLILVSSSHHMRRASMIFKSVFSSAGQPVVIFCSPSRYSEFNAEKWWRTKEGTHIVFTEYLKMAYFLLIDKWKL